MKRSLPVVLILAGFLAGCGGAATSDVKVVVGAQLPSKGLEYSVVVVEGKTIREVGPQSDVPVPKGSQITSGLGKVLEPAPGGEIGPGQPATFSLRNAQTTVIEARMIEGVWK